MIPYQKLMEFVDSNSPVKAHPWTAPGNKTVVTDSRIMLVVDGVYRDTPPPIEGAKYPDYEKLLKVTNLDQKIEVLDLSGVKIEKTEWTCKNCKGTGKIAVCEDCDGEGDHQCNCGDTHECRTCRGEGHVPGAKEGSRYVEDCEDCEGTGKDAEWSDVILGNHKFSGKLIEKIMSLPGFRNMRTNPTPGWPAAFDFDGGMGLVMCMTPTEKTA